MESEQQAFDQPNQESPTKKITNSLKMEDSQKRVLSSKSAITNDEIKCLYEARSRFREFVQAIGSIRYSTIRNDVIEHCDRLKVNLNLQLLTFENIEFMMKNRIDKIIKNKKIKKNWSQQDVFILIWIISKFSDYHSLEDIENQLSIHHWELIASMIPGVKSQNCMFKWLSLKKINLAQNCWSEIQSNILTSIIKEHGTQNWNFVAQELYTQNTEQQKIFRCPKQCREHWNCYLNPKLKKGPWTKEEDLILLKKIVENQGRKKWAQFVKFFNGRTQNALKNRYSLLLQKQIKNSKALDSKSEYKIIQDYLHKTYLGLCMNPEGKHLEQNDQTKLSLSKESLKPIRIMTLRDRKKKSASEKMDDPNSKIKKLKKQKSLKNVIPNEDEVLERGNPQNQESVKHESIPQDSPFQSIDNHFIRSEFSDFTPAKVEMSNFFNKGESNQKKTLKIQPIIESKFMLPSVENIQVVPFNIETLQGLKNFTKDIVPCEMIQNKLYQFHEKK